MLSTWCFLRRWFRNFSSAKHGSPPVICSHLLGLRHTSSEVSSLAVYMFPSQFKCSCLLLKFFMTWAPCTWRNISPVYQLIQQLLSSQQDLLVVFSLSKICRIARSYLLSTGGGGQRVYSGSGEGMHRCNDIMQKWLHHISNIRATVWDVLAKPYSKLCLKP